MGYRIIGRHDVVDKMNTFNSLYGILIKLELIERYPNVTFNSLYGIRYAEITGGTYFAMCFQFPLWDTVVPIRNGFGDYATFNSLYGIP